MAKPFDATTKHLVEFDPAAWLAYLDIPFAGDVETLSPDLASISLEADVVLRVRAPEPWLVQLEMQSGRDPTLPERLLRYSVLLLGRHARPVQSVIVLLRPAANGPELTGRLRLALPNGRQYLDFEYDVVRVWERPVEQVLVGGLATLPLAPLAAGAQDRLPEIVRRMDARFEREAEPSEARELRDATWLLMGLRYPRHIAAGVIRQMNWVKDSDTYHWVLDEGRAVGLAEGRAVGLAEGRAEGARESLLRVGRKRLGEPTPEVLARIAAIGDAEQLEALCERALDVSTWQELLAFV